MYSVLTIGFGSIYCVYLHQSAVASWPKHDFTMSIYNDYSPQSFLRENDPRAVFCSGSQRQTGKAIQRIAEQNLWCFEESSSRFRGIKTVRRTSKKFEEPANSEGHLAIPKDLEKLWRDFMLKAGSKGTSINCFIEILRFMLSRFLCGGREHSELCDQLTIKKIRAENQKIIKVPMLGLYIVWFSNGQFIEVPVREMDKTRAVKSHLNGCGLAFYLRCATKQASNAKASLERGRMLIAAQVVGLIVV